MATFTILPSGSIRVRIRRKGSKPLDKVFREDREAKAWAQQVERECVNKSVAYDKSPGAITLQDAWESYCLSVKYSEKATSTQAREARAIKAVLRLIGHRALKHLDEAAIQTEYIDKRAIETGRFGKVSGDTVRIELAALSAVLVWAKKRGMIDRNPARGADYEKPRIKSREGRISRETEKKLFAIAIRLARKQNNSSGLNWLKFMFETGSRPGEAAKIELKWINKERSTITIPSWAHKTRSERSVIINIHHFEEQIRAAKEAGSKWLFWSQTRKKELRDFNYSQLWKTMKKKLPEIEGLGAHMIRHEFISRLFEETDFSDSQIANLVGDKHTASLKPYTHLRTNKLRPKLNAHLIEEIYRRMPGLREIVNQAMAN